MSQHLWRLAGLVDLFVLHTQLHLRSVTGWGWKHRLCRLSHHHAWLGALKQDFFCVRLMNFQVGYWQQFPSSRSFLSPHLNCSITFFPSRYAPLSHQFIKLCPRTSEPCFGTFYLQIQVWPSCTHGNTGHGLTVPMLLEGIFDNQFSKGKSGRITRQNRTCGLLYI